MLNRIMLAILLTLVFAFADPALGAVKLSAAEVIALEHLPQRAGTSRAYLQARRSLAFIESRGDVSARNAKSSAKGKYQFTKAWDPWFARRYGRTWASVVPARSATPAAKAIAGRHQDKMFDLYYNEIVSPWISGIRSRGLGRSYSDASLLALIHRQGAREAERFLRTGHDPNVGIAGNRHVTHHIAAMSKQMEFERYLAAPIPKAQLASEK